MGFKVVELKLKAMVKVKVMAKFKYSILGDPKRKNLTLINFDNTYDRVVKFKPDGKVIVTFGQGGAGL